MDHFVPEFDVDEDYINPPSSVLPRQKNVHDDEVLELLWQNGQVVVQSQNPRLQRKSSPPPHKFLPEDEMMSWLQYPLEDPPFNRELNDLFSLPPPGPPPPPPFPPSLPHHRETQIPFQPDSGALESCRTNEMRESMVDSSDTPAIRQKPNFPVITRDSVEIKNRRNRFRDSFSGADGCGIGRNSMSGVSREVDTCDLTMTSSPGGRSGASLSGTATADLMTLPPADDRRSKGRELVDEANTEYQSEDAEIESYEPKQQTRGGATKRSRAAEVHNQSERRRRDRINEKMKALQELVPRCSKTDKASMLDEAIEYLKSLQMQVQMMSMGCGMVPVMFPGVQQYMLSMGMGMGMGVGMPQQMMPFPGVLSGSAMPTQGAASHLNQRFPFQGFQMPPIPETDPARVQQPSNQAEFIMPRIPSLPDPYQQCTNIQQMPVQITQNQPSIGKRSANRGCKDNVNPSTG